MKIIKDPVHGYIEVAPCALDLLDSPMLQRLRYIRQLGFSFLVYPGAHHTRFEHSLGTLYLANVMARQLNLQEEELTLVAAAALLHDIGHGPFSHAIEPVMEEFCGRSHHEVSWLLEDPGLSGCLERYGILQKEVCAVLSGNHSLSGIIHGELDVDRMDYLLRDAHYTGAPYGTVDAHRLIRNTCLSDGSITLEEGGVNAAESLLIARTLMRPAVYYHHVSRIAEMMLSSAVRAHLEKDPGANPSEFMRLDDAGCMQTLMQSPSDMARILAIQIYQRRLYKRAVYVGWEQVGPTMIAQKMHPAQRQNLSSAIAEAAGVEPHEVLVDIPEFPSSMSVHVRIRNRNRVIGLEEIPPLVTTLNETRRGQWRLGVYTPAVHVPIVSTVAREILHIRPLTTQERLRF